MTAIRALIVDDEPLARRGIRQLLAPYPDIAVVGECRDGREALRALATLEVDLLFLDVQMPGIDGLDVVRIHGAERLPWTVFVTAHDQFAVQAFEAQALDYLVKPLSEARFRNAIERVRERIRLRDAVSVARRLTDLLGGRERPGATDPPAAEARPGPAITVPTPTGELVLDAAEIDWIEAEDYYALIHAGDRRHRVRQSLGALETVLGPVEFVRIHRSLLVRLSRIREWRASGDEIVVVLPGGRELPVSRRRAAQVKALLRSPGRRSS